MRAKIYKISFICAKILSERLVSSMKKAIIIPNCLKQESLDFAKELGSLLDAKGYKAEILMENDVPNSGADFAIVLGGDGTLLRACKKLYKLDIPMLGVNFGHLGYLTECSPDVAFGAIDKILKGDYTLEKRLMLKGEVIRNGQSVYSFVALNEAVRELLGSGAVFGFSFGIADYMPLVFVLAPGAFLVLGYLMALFNKFAKK